MRGPIVVGVLAGLLVAALVAGLFVAYALRDPTPPLAPIAPSSPPAGERSSSTTPNATAPVSQGPLGSLVPRTPRSSGVSASGTVVPSPSGSPEPDVGVAVGDIAPPLRLAQLGGSEVDTTALRGQPLWVNFMATWCPPCREELPIMDRLQRELGDRMTIIVVDVEEDADTVASFFSGLEVALPVALDEDGSAQDAWGALALPVHYWIDEDGRVGGFLYGGAGPEQFIEGIETVLPDAGLEP